MHDPNTSVQSRVLPWQMVALSSALMAGALSAQTTFVPKYGYLKNTTLPVVVDGVRETHYFGALGSLGSTTRADLAAPDNSNDLSAEWRGMFDSKNFFVFVSIKDDIALAGDSFEVMIDTDNSKAATPDGVNDYHLVFAPQLDSLVGAVTVTAGTLGNPASLDLTKIIAKYVKTTVGWDLEIQIPLAQVPVSYLSETVFGLDFVVNDYDVESTLSHQRTWSANAGPSPDLYGVATLIFDKKYLVKSTTAAIVIDGDKDSAYNSAFPGAMDRPDRPNKSKPPAESVAPAFFMLVDADHLYVFANIVDDNFSADSPTDPISGYQSWNDDSFEIYFDGNRNKNGKHDGYDDVKFAISPRADATWVVQDATAFPAPPVGTDFSGCQYATKVTENNWSVEMKIPLTLLGIDNVAGWQFGLDFQINDDDAGGNAENKVTWSAADKLNDNTKLYGVAELYKGRELDVKKTTATIAIDGTKDAAFNSAFVGELELPSSPTAAVPAKSTLAVKWFPLYDLTNLYLFIDVTDPDFFADSAPDYFRDDSVELYIDGDNSRKGAHDGVNDFKWTLAPQTDGSLIILDTGNFPAPPAGADFSNVQFATAKTATGYTIEAKIPLELLDIQPVEGWKFGIDLQVNDDDDGGDFNNRLTWSAADRLNNGTNRYGTATLFEKKAIHVAKAAAAPMIDGDFDAAYEFASMSQTRRAGNNTSPIAAPNDLNLFWYPLYDMENLYLFLDIIDPNFVVDNLDPIQQYNDDSYEIFIDGDGNGGGKHDGKNDFKWTLAPKPDGTLEIIDVANFPAPPVGADFSGVQFAHKRSPGNNGWQMEAKIPLSLLGIQPHFGYRFGIDFQLNDDDDGGNRDKLLTWSAATKLNDNTGAYGTAYLGGRDHIGGMGSDYESLNYSEWFGYYYTDAAPWMYSFTLADWVYPVSAESGLFLWSATSTSWMYTSSTVFPFVYDFTGGIWVSKVL